MAAAYLDAAGAGAAPGGLDVATRNEPQWADVVRLARGGVHAPLTSSAGRLFDAAAAVLGVRDAVNYEGQAAIELEQLADPGQTAAGAYRAAIEPGEPFTVRGADLIAAIVADLRAGLAREVIAARFHGGIIALVEAGCALLRERHGLGTVALSGGVFQNLLLLGGAVSRLEARGFRVLTHSRVPCNDGGISLGQAVVAAARDRAG
jgi:hydrogenase maturation protein HypF